MKVTIQGVQIPLSGAQWAAKSESYCEPHFRTLSWHPTQSVLLVNIATVVETRSALLHTGHTS